jgi:molybdopterin-containing oxidoreductase family membrane subunit
MGMLLLMFSFAWGYFIFCDYLTGWYGYFAIRRQLDEFILKGPSAFLWWLMIFVNLVVPWATLWSRRVRRSPFALSLVSLGVILGMYVERVIIMTSLRIDQMPFNWGFYNPSPVEISILCGTFSLFVFIYALVTRLVPVVPLWEIHEAQQRHRLRKVGKAFVVSVSELE